MDKNYDEGQEKKFLEMQEIQQENVQISGLKGVQSPQPLPGESQGYNYDPVSPLNVEQVYAQPLGIASNEERMGFIRKVYGILSFQILLTAGMCLVPLLSSAASAIILRSLWLFIVTVCIAFITSCALMCVKSLARSVPINYVLLLVFTACEAYSVMYICAAIGDGSLVATAAFLTAGIVLALTIYALTTKRDFTLCGGLVAVLSAAFLMAVVAGFFLGPSFHLVLSVLGVVLFGVYLVYDTQLICGGRNQEMKSDDYIIAAMTLYLDIVNIFIYILQILASSSKD